MVYLRRTWMGNWGNIKNNELNQFIAMEAFTLKMRQHSGWIYAEKAANIPSFLVTVSLLCEQLRLWIATITTWNIKNILYQTISFIASFSLYRGSLRQGKTTVATFTKRWTPSKKHVSQWRPKVAPQFPLRFFAANSVVFAATPLFEKSTNLHAVKTHT